MMEVRRGPNLRTWALVALGMAVLALLVALLLAMMRLNARSSAVAQTPAQPVAPLPSTGPAVAQAPAQPVTPEMSQVPPVAQAPAQPVSPLQTTAPAVAQAPQQTVPPASTTAEALAGGEQEQPCSTGNVKRWVQVARFTGSGLMTTPSITVACPWRLHYWTGVSPASDLGLDNFMIAYESTVPLMGRVPVAMVSVQRPRYEAYAFGPKALTNTPLTIATNFNDWIVIVEQGYYQ